MENQESEIPNDEISQSLDIKAKRPKNKVALLAVLTVLLISALGLLANSLLAPTKLESAVEKCFKSNASVSVDEDGKGLFLDGKGDKSSGVSVEDTVCVLKFLDVPDSVISRMSNTTALMGQQSANWDDLNVLWTYHPSNGLDLSFELG